MFKPEFGWNFEMDQDFEKNIYFDLFYFLYTINSNETNEIDNLN